MDFVRGEVVCSRAGHDKGSFFTIVRIENGFAYIADGRGRSVLDPKKKNLLHLAQTKTVLSEQILRDDSTVRRALKGFMNSPETLTGR